MAWSTDTGWPRHIIKAAEAMYNGRICARDNDRPMFHELNIDQFDHWCILAELATHAADHERGILWVPSPSTGDQNA